MEPDKSTLPLSQAKRILVMDDDVAVKKAFKRILGMVGYDVELAGDGLEAIETYVQAKESHQPFFAVIMDLSVSNGMGGLQAVKRLLEIAPQAKVIATSGRIDDPVMTDFQKFGFCGVIAKPFQIHEVCQILRELIGGGEDCTSP